MVMQRQISYLLLSVLSLFFMSLTTRPSETKHQIDWKENQLLSWEDFKGTISKSSPYDAYTMSGVSTEYSGEGNEMKVNIRAVFNQKDSKKKKGMDSAYLLNHEQRHFDITEVFARRLRKTVSEITFSSYKQIDNEMTAVIRKNVREWNKIQNTYDKETQHSKNKTKQAEWNQKIDDWLNELSDFSHSNYTIDLSYL